MSLEQYNVNTNPFAALSSMIKDKDSSGRMSLNHALILNQVHHAGVMEHLERSHELQSVADTVAHRRDLAKQRITHSQSLELESQKAKSASELSAQTHAQTIEAASHQAGIAEAEARGTHRRTTQLIKGIHGLSEPGTKVEINAGDISAKFTKAKPAAETTFSETSSGTATGRGWLPSKPGASSLPIVGKPSAAPAKPSGSVTRDPKTGRAMSLKATAEKPVKKSSTKKASVSGASVTRDPKTGRAISLKK